MACNLTLVLANLYIESASLLPSDATSVGYNECEDIITLVMASLCSKCGHYIFALWFLLLLSIFFYSSPNISRRRLAVYHTSTHGVALVRI